MEFSCPQCNIKGKIDDSKIPPNGITATCPKCGSKFLVQKEPALIEESEFIIAAENTVAVNRNRHSDEKFCHGCGKVLHTSAQFCPTCGATQTTQDVMHQHKSNKQQLSYEQIYCSSCGKPVHKSASSCPSCGARQKGIGTKSRTTAIILAILLGGIGGHKFYLGQTGLGLVYLLFCATFIPAIVAIFDAISYANMDDYSFSQKYA